MPDVFRVQSSDFWTRYPGTYVEAMDSSQALMVGGLVSIAGDKRRSGQCRPMEQTTDHFGWRTNVL